MTINMIAPPGSLAFIYLEINLKVIPRDNLEQNLKKWWDFRETRSNILLKILLRHFFPIVNQTLLHVKLSQLSFEVGGDREKWRKICENHPFFEKMWFSTKIYSFLKFFSAQKISTKSSIIDHPSKIDILSILENSIFLGIHTTYLI